MASGSLKIGLIDGNVALRDAVTKWILHAGIGELAGEAVSSIHEAIEMRGGAQPDVILLDVRTPSAFSKADVGQLQRTYPEARVILMSHYAFESEDGSLPPGVDACLNKAFLIERLTPLLRSLFPDRYQTA